MWLVLEGGMDVMPSRGLGMGGRHLAEFIKQALAWKETSENKAPTASSLDAPG